MNVWLFGMTLFFIWVVLTFLFSISHRRKNIIIGAINTKSSSNQRINYHNWIKFWVFQTIQRIVEWKKSFETIFFFPHTFWQYSICKWINTDRKNDWATVMKEDDEKKCGANPIVIEILALNECRVWNFVAHKKSASFAYTSFFLFEPFPNERKNTNWHKVKQKQTQNRNILTFSGMCKSLK